MATIDTTHGPMEANLLQKREGIVDNDDEHTTWVEYWLDSELVHRSAHVHLKRGIGSLMAQGSFS